MRQSLSPCFTCACERMLSQLKAAMLLRLHVMRSRTMSSMDFILARQKWLRGGEIMRYAGMALQAGHYIDDGSGLSGTESLPGSAEKGKAPAEVLQRAETLKRRCIKVRHLPPNFTSMLMVY